MTKGIIYYTDNRLDEEITQRVQGQILKSGLPIVSCSLKPLGFGKNIVLDLEPSAITMVKQILTALKASDSDYVFFCEHDVLYHLSHFNFIPPNDNIFYYNTNVWRWDYSSDKVITYDHLRSLSGLCVYRDKVLEHFNKKMKTIIDKSYDKIPVTRNPAWARKYGYEPSEKNGEVTEEWRSEFPNIDIRHNNTMTPRKMKIEDFVHKPTGWKESIISELWPKEDFNK